jgi:hypothetical protein
MDAAELTARFFAAWRGSRCSKVLSRQLVLLVLRMRLLVRVL